MIFHITSRADWQKAKETGKYRDKAFLKDGFIHCSTLSQVLGVANSLFKDQRDLVLLGIDVGSVKATVRYEDLCESGRLYPHIYGELNVDAVVAVWDFPYDGSFGLPEDIDKLKSISVVLTDVDGTLVNGHIYVHLFKYMLKRKWRITRTYPFFLYILFSLLRSKIGKHDRMANQDRWAYGIAWLFRGISEEEIDSVLEGATEKIAADFRTDLVKGLVKMQKQGYRVLLASTGVTPLIEAIAKAVGADGYIGTPLRVSNGVYTGELAGAVCNGIHKVRSADVMLEGEGYVVDWSKSWGFSDGSPDIPMLKAVGYPVVVEPDEELLEAALENGWAEF